MRADQRGGHNRSGVQLPLEQRRLTWQWQRMYPPKSCWCPYLYYQPTSIPFRYNSMLRGTLLQTDDRD